MKPYFALFSLCFISACSISSSKEIKQAEKLLAAHKVTIAFLEEQYALLKAE